MARKSIDRNQPEIVKALRGIGATVQSLADLGKGAPDLLVGFFGRNVLFEIKDWKQPPSRRRLTPDEKEWHDMWRGQVTVVETFEEALAVLQASKQQFLAQAEPALKHLADGNLTKQLKYSLLLKEMSR